MNNINPNINPNTNQEIHVPVSYRDKVNREIFHDKPYMRDIFENNMREMEEKIKDTLNTIFDRPEINLYNNICLSKPCVHDVLYPHERVSIEDSLNEEPNKKFLIKINDNKDGFQIYGFDHDYIKRVIFNNSGGNHIYYACLPIPIKKKIIKRKRNSESIAYVDLVEYVPSSITFFQLSGIFGPTQENYFVPLENIVYILDNPQIKYFVQVNEPDSSHERLTRLSRFVAHRENCEPVSNRKFVYIYPFPGNPQFLKTQGGFKSRKARRRKKMRRLKRLKRSKRRSKKHI